MNPSSMHCGLARTAASSLLAALAAGTMFFTVAAQARPVHVNDGAVVLTAPQLVIPLPGVQPTPAVHVHAVQPAHARPVLVHTPVHQVTGPVAYRPGRVYYIHGRPYLNGHPYRGQFRHRGHGHHHDHRADRHDGHHNQGHHLGWGR